MLYILKRNPTTRLIVFVIADAISIVLAIWIAFLFRFEGHIPANYAFFIPRLMILAILIIIPIFYFQKLYSFSWSYVSASEAIALFSATSLSFILISVVVLFIFKNYFNYLNDFPRSTLLLSYMLVFALCSGSRFSKRIYFRMIGFNKIVGERTLIVGAGDVGEQILRNILSLKIKSYLPVGFVDDSSMKQGVKIHGVRVLGRISDIPKVIRNYQIKQLIIAIPSANNSLIKKAIELGRQAGLYKIKIAPQISAIMSGEVSVKSLKNVEVEDLLGRSPVNLIDKKQIENLIQKKVILITGAAGSIGSELSRQVAIFKPSLLMLLDQDETGIFNIEAEIRKNFPSLKIQPLVINIQDKEKVSNIFTEFKPTIVFHAAAYKHVPLMEIQPDQAVKNNIFGTEILVKVSVQNLVEKFIFISTDKAVNPTSVMGATKRVGEMICQIYNQKNKTKFISVRFGNVLDSRGSVIPIFREQLRKRENITVTHPEMKRYFMITSEACLLVLQAGAMGQGGEVFVLDMGKPIKILDLAREMIKLSGYTPDKDIAIVFTGIRPGEKLFEEFLTAEEGTMVTQNQKIFMAKMSNINFQDMEKHLDNLKNIVNEANSKKTIDFLKSITPYYK